MAEMLKTGDLQRHIRRTLQPAYSSRYRAMMEAIEQHLLPLGVTMAQVDREVVGGYFIWLTLPEPLDAGVVAAQAKKAENVVVAPGTLFGVAGNSKAEDFRREIRLCFSWEDEEKLGEGVERLARAVRRMQAESSARERRPSGGISIMDGGHH